MKNLVTLRFMLISLFAAMSMVMNAETVEYKTDEGFRYELDTETKTAVLLECSNSAIEVVIPASVTYKNTEYSVTSLGNYCFNNCSSLTSVTIPSSVTSLGDNCFNNCSSLTSVTIPSSVTSLGDGCFGGCYSLTSIIIPSSVTSIGVSCFVVCPSLLQMVVDENNPVYDSRENCNAIIKTESNTMISACASTVIPSSVTSLGDFCFSGCSSLTSITIPSFVTSLGDGCFSGCSSLTSITIPSSVTSIGDYCFIGCPSLLQMVVDENNPVYDSRENCNAIIKTESNTMISACASTVIPSSVTSLGEGCFSGCSSLTSITIPSSVTSLGNWCFESCN